MYLAAAPPVMGPQVRLLTANIGNSTRGCIVLLSQVFDVRLRTHKVVIATLFQRILWRFAFHAGSSDKI